MIKLMKLELKRMSLRPYIICVIAFSMGLLAFIYFVAYVAQVEQELQFQEYKNIFRITMAVSIILFSILSAVMYSHLIIDEYTGNRPTLLFSYSVSRKSILIAKILVVFLFVLLSMLFCTMVPLTIFSITESISPIVGGDLKEELFASCQLIVTSIISVASIGVVSMRNGFIKKSISMTLICAFALSGLFGNIAVGSADNSSIALLIMGFYFIIAMIAVFELSNKIENMEVE